MVGVPIKYTEVWGHLQMCLNSAHNLIYTFTLYSLLWLPQLAGGMTLPRLQGDTIPFIGDSTVQFLGVPVTIHDTKAEHRGALPSKHEGMLKRLMKPSWPDSRSCTSTAICCLIWDIANHNHPITWVTKNLETMATRYLERWSELARDGGGRHLLMCTHEHTTMCGGGCMWWCSMHGVCANVCVVWYLYFPVV